MLASGAAQFQGAGLGIVSTDPTTLSAEGIGGTSLEENPQIYTGRVVQRPPQSNDDIGLFGMFGQCAESWQQGLGCQYGVILTRIVDPTAATREAELDLATADPANSGGTDSHGQLRRLLHRRQEPQSDPGQGRSADAS